MTTSPGAPAPPAVRSEAPSVSVIVPAHDARGHLGACLRALQANHPPPLELIVAPSVDPRSTFQRDEIYGDDGR